MQHDLKEICYKSSYVQLSTTCLPNASNLSTYNKTNSLYFFSCCHFVHRLLVLYLDFESWCFRDLRKKCMFSELCPNISNARGHGAVRYLLHKRYIEVSLSLQCKWFNSSSQLSTVLKNLKRSCDCLLYTKKQHKLSKKLVQHIREVLLCKNWNKTSVPMFYHGNKIMLLFQVRTRDLIHTPPNSYPYLLPR